MHSLLRSRRGGISFAFLIIAIPLIGAFGFATEAALWYTIKRNAQNAADAAAYSGGLRLACSLGANCPDVQTYQYRGKELAAQNAFCNTGDTAYPGSLCGTLPKNTSQSVAIAQGTYTPGAKFAATPGSGMYVLATVAQVQPAYFVSMFGMSSINIAAQAVARVNIPPKQPCALALTGSISFQDSAVNVQAPNCGLASDAAGVGLDFSAHPTVNVGSLTTTGSCVGSTSQCSTTGTPPVFTYFPPVTNPLAGLNAPLASLTLPSCATDLTPYTPATPCATNNFSANKAMTLTTSGVYFFKGGFTLKGGGSIVTGAGVSATIILLPTGAPSPQISMAGNSSINITAQLTVPTTQLPAALQSSAGLLSDVAIVDLESGTPKTNGGATISASGVMYFPNANLNLQGNPTATSCQEVIAASLQLAGSPKFDNTGCPSSVKLSSQYVSLVY